MLSTAFALTLACAASSAEQAARKAPPAAQPAALAFKAARIHLGDGNTIENAVLVVRNGKVESVGDGPAPAGMSLIELKGELSPGMLATSTRLLAPGEWVDSSLPYLEGAELQWGFDWRLPEPRKAVEQGITSALLAPLDTQVVGGLCATLRLSSGEVLRSHAALGISLTGDAADRDRGPTSYSGALAGLRERLLSPKGIWAEVKAGSLPCLIAVEERHEVTRALQWAGENKLTGMLRGAALFGELLPEIEASGLALIAPSFGPSEASGRSIEALVALSNSGRDFAFELEDSEHFRFAAAAALRAGGNVQALERALFQGAARLAGVEERVGSLSAGRDADFVIWSGEPLSLSSHVEAVYVQGSRVYAHHSN